MDITIILFPPNRAAKGGAIYGRKLTYYKAYRVGGLVVTSARIPREHNPHRF
jgi:predicted outer membrane repeat protein